MHVLNKRGENRIRLAVGGLTVRGYPFHSHHGEGDCSGRHQEDLRAPRRKRQHCWFQTLPVARKCCSAKASELPDRTSSLLAPSVSVEVLFLPNTDELGRIPLYCHNLHVTEIFGFAHLDPVDRVNPRSRNTCVSGGREDSKRNCSRPCSM